MALLEEVVLMSISIYLGPCAILNARLLSCHLRRYFGERFPYTSLRKSSVQRLDIDFTCLGCPLQSPKEIFCRESETPIPNPNIFLICMDFRSLQFSTNFFMILILQRTLLLEAY